MTVKINNAALKHARRLIRDAKATRDIRDDWSEHAPDAGQEYSFIKNHGFAEYGKWHLGEDDEKTPETKGRYSFPYGDFRRLHRAPSSPSKAAPPRVTTTTSPRPPNPCWKSWTRTRPAIGSAGTAGGHRPACSQVRTNGEEWHT